MPDFSPAVWAVIGVLIVVELVLLITGLVLVSRTPTDRLTLPRIAWILICFIQFIGPIAFFVAGRRPAEVVEGARVPGRESSVDSTVDELYR